MELEAEYTETTELPKQVEAIVTFDTPEQMGIGMDISNLEIHKKIYDMFCAYCKEHDLVSPRMYANAYNGALSLDLGFSENSMFIESRIITPVQPFKEVDIYHHLNAISHNPSKTEAYTFGGATGLRKTDENVEGTIIYWDIRLELVASEEGTV